MAQKFQFEKPDDALCALADNLATSGIEPGCGHLTGRVLAADAVADRDSPAADMSAMDGYGIRLQDLEQTDAIPVQAESVPGAPPPELQTGSVIRIFTGAIVPKGCEAVVMREDTEELDHAIRFRQSAMSIKFGENIRRAGENAKSGSVVLARGIEITAANQATMTNFGCFEPDVYAKVRVSIITTGDEVGLLKTDVPKPWQLRNSNRASLSSLLELVPWAEIAHVDHCIDDRDSLTRLIGQRLSQSDAIIMTGGVSMGDYDYVPDVVRALGGKVVFHGLPIRPGKPILGAATGDGKLVMGLPGNPVSATVGCRRMAIPLLAKISGQTEWLRPCPVVRLADADARTIPLHWMRLVRLTDHGVAQLVPSKGSGDLVSLGQSSGFVELPPGACGEGPWPYHAWTK